MLLCYPFLQTFALPQGPKAIGPRQPWWWTNWGNDGASDDNPDIDVSLGGSGIDVDIDIDVDSGDGGGWPTPSNSVAPVAQFSTSEPAESSVVYTHPKVATKYARPTVTSAKTSTIQVPTSKQNKHVSTYVHPTNTPSTIQTSNYVPSSTPSGSAPSGTASGATPSDTASGAVPSGSSQSGGCPADSSSPKSDGVNGAPSKAMIDSINYIRQYWFPDQNHHCLKWSTSLAEYAQKVVESGGDEPDNARPLPGGTGNIAIIWGSAYGGGYTVDTYASTLFEQSLFTMLCEKKADSHLHGTCAASLGPQNNLDPGCYGVTNPSPDSLKQCIGHYTTIVDADNAYAYMGCHAASNGWSCQFSIKQ